MIKRHQIKVTLELPFSTSELTLHCIICEVMYLSFSKEDSQGICSPKADSWFHVCATAKSMARQNAEQINFRTVLQP